MIWFILSLVVPMAIIGYSDREYRRSLEPKQQPKPQNNYLSKRHNK